MQVDPDAPSPDAPKFRYWLHWLVTNIPGVDVKRGNVVVDYMGPVSFILLHWSRRVVHPACEHRLQNLA